MIIFYGAPNSSAGRTHWALEEIGVPYEYRRIDTRKGETKTEAFRAVSPGGKIPALVDGDVRLVE